MASFRFPKINLTVQLLAIIVFVGLFHNYFNPTIEAALYATSLTLKEILVFTLPVIIFSCIYSCMLSFKDKAIAFMFLVMLGVCVSNFISVWVGFGASKLALHHIHLATSNGLSAQNVLAPLWQLTLPKWLANEVALLIGFLAGTLFTFKPNPKADQLSEIAKKTVHIILNKIFIPVLPIFALGFVVKMAHDGVLDDIATKYIWVLALVVVTFIAYILFLYGLSANFKPKTWLRFIKNVIPAGIMGFSSMSSLAAMPVNIVAAEENTQKPVAARAVIPATVNIHLIGDSICIPIMAIALLMTFGMGFPSLETFAIFTGYFVLAKFAVAAVPGGGILVMIPIMEQYLGFTPEMSAMITAMYILFDPLLTCTNVLGNGAFAILMTKFFKDKEPDEGDHVNL
ncbi:MAG: cation:dicarboxylase symporter family transporter [Gammaproteobacteria bacterium]